MLSRYKCSSFLRPILVRVPPTTFLQCGLLGVHFLSFWPFGPSFPLILAFWAFISFILAFWAFISFYIGLLCFLSFWPYGPSFPFILAFWAFICFHFGLFNSQKKPSGQDLAQNCDFPFKICNFSFSKICLLGLHFLSFWHFLGLHFLSFWPFGRSFPFILAFLGVHFFHFGLLGFHFLSFFAFWACQKSISPGSGPKWRFSL